MNDPAVLLVQEDLGVLSNQDVDEVIAFVRAYICVLLNFVA